MRLLYAALLSLCSLSLGAQTIAEQYHDLLAKSKEIYQQAIENELEIIRVSGNQLSSNASDYEEGQHIDNLVDGNPNTFWHSDWHNQVYDTHYIQIDFNEPVSDNIGLYVVRRRTEANHVTLMGVLGSNDNENWDDLGEIWLGNAYYGLEYTSDLISLGEESYKSLRFTILENTNGTIFGHFAEFHPYHYPGPFYQSDLGNLANNLKYQIEEGEYLTDDKITSRMLQDLQKAYDAFCAELGVTVAGQYRELLAKSKVLYQQAVIEQMEKIPVSANQLSSNASDYAEGQHIEYLVDGDPDSFWHSDWHGQVSETHYIQVDFSEPVSDNVGLYVLRRKTAANHVTLMGVLGSNDNTEWDNLGEMELGNASSGQEYTSDPVSLGGKSYKSLRFTILANTDGNVFGHFAEFYPMHYPGPFYESVLGYTATNLKKLITEGENLKDEEITSGKMQELQIAYDALRLEMDAPLVKEYRELLEKSKDIYRLAVGKESEVIPITANQLSSNASDWQEGQHIEYLVDYNPYTFWHSDWHSQVHETHYIQVDFNEPVGGNIGLYVVRRFESGNHVTLMGVLGSNNNSQWNDLGEIVLGNASSGQEFTSDPVSLGDNKYKSLRFTILENSSGNHFGHFAEFFPTHVTVYGPSYIADMGHYATRLRMLIDEGDIMADGDITDDVLQELQEAYDIFCAELKNLQDGGSPTYMKQLTNLPAVYINTYDGSNIDSKYNYKYAKLWRIQDGETEFIDSLQIRGRGNSTWGVPKKPYRIKFKTKEKFLGKGYAKARNWTLMANAVDKTLIRNAVASFIGEQLGQKFVPAAKFVDLTLNGNYIGNYQISDHLDIRPHRIDIVEQVDYATEESDISGGYFMEVGSPGGDQEINFRTNRGVTVGVKSPDEDVIQYEQIEYIRDFMNNVESHIFSADYQDPENGYRALFDSLALASWYLTVEYSANCDGLYSIYCYKDQADDHLYMGPIWDYDIAFNNCYRLGEMTDKLMIDYGYSSNERQWFRRMYNDPWFLNLIGRRWHKAVLQENLVDKTLSFVDSLAAVMDESQQLNYQIWPINQRTWDELQLFSTYQEGIDYLKTFLVEHAAYLSTVFPNPDGIQPPEPEPTNPMGIDKNAYYYIYNVGVDHPVDICDGSDLLGTWNLDDNRYMTQHWQIQPVTADYYRFVSRESNLAITDMAEGSDDGQYATGSQLQVQPVDEKDNRQLWRFVLAADNWAIENKETHLAWNNSNGGSEDGNPVISWTNNADNASKPTRQWYIEKADESIVDGMASMWKEDFDYRITMDSNKQIHIRIPNGVENVQGTIALYDLNGRMLASGSVTEAVDASMQPSGVYILKWTVNGHSRSRKLRL
jgi:hypothetical protein